MKRIITMLIAFLSAFPFAHGQILVDKKQYFQVLDIAAKSEWDVYQCFSILDFGDPKEDVENKLKEYFVDDNFNVRVAPMGNDVFAMKLSCSKGDFNVMIGNMQYHEDDYWDYGLWSITVVVPVEDMAKFYRYMREKEDYTLFKHYKVDLKNDKYPNITIPDLFSEVKINHNKVIYEQIQDGAVCFLIQNQPVAAIIENYDADGE